MRLNSAIKVLCPDLSAQAIARAEVILDGGRLLGHGRLPQADYKLPVASKGSGLGEALAKVVVEMARRCNNGGWGALAATQVGLTYPVIVSGSASVVTHPRFMPSPWSRKQAFTFEGCGSLPRAHYLGTYPAVAWLTYHQYDGRLVWRRASVSPWFVTASDIDIENALSLSILIHETRHLHGQTAANGFIAHPGRVVDRGFNRTLFAFLGVNRPFRDSISCGLGSDDWTSLPPKLVLIAYILAGNQFYDDNNYLLPAGNGFRLVTAEQLVEELK